jgi:hypothetical protein
MYYVPANIRSVLYLDPVQAATFRRYSEILRTSFIVTAHFVTTDTDVKPRDLCV